MRSEHIIDSLLKLRDSDLLAEEAKSDIAAMIRLQQSGEYDLQATTSAIYSFLVNPVSPGGRLLRQLLDGYAGDLLSELWNTREDPVGIWADTIIDTAPALKREPSSLLSSAELLCAIIAFNRPDMEALASGKTFNLRMSLICDFLEDRGIDPGSLCLSLLHRQNSELDSSLLHRYSLDIRILESGYLQAAVQEQWGQHSFVDNESRIVATQGLLIPERVVFLPSEILIFEQLLNANPPSPEEAFQEFFEAHPKWLFLLGEQYERAIPQVRLPPVKFRETLAFVDGQTDEGNFFPDFMLKRIGLELWDIVDLKRAKPKIVVGRKGRRQFSEAVREAIAQLRGYADRLRQQEVRDFLRHKYGITVVRPVAMVVIGRDFEFKTLREKDTLRISDGVRVYTYDDIRRLAKHRSLLV